MFSLELVKFEIPFTHLNWDDLLNGHFYIQVCSSGERSRLDAVTNGQSRAREDRRSRNWALGTPGNRRLGRWGGTCKGDREGTASEVEGNLGVWSPESQEEKVFQGGRRNWLCQMQLKDQVGWLTVGCSNVQDTGNFNGVLGTRAEWSSQREWENCRPNSSWGVLL